MTMTLKGGSDLRARLLAVAGVAEDFAREWADTTVKKARATAPHARRAASFEWTTRVSGKRAGVYGAFWWIFVDRGTKAHEISARGRSGAKWRSGPRLVFKRGGETVFAKSVHHKRTARRPFISRAAQDALSQNTFADTVLQSWALRRLRAHRRFLP